MPCLLVLTLLTIIAVVFLKGAHIETIVFNKELNTFYLKRTHIVSATRMTSLKLSDIESVFAVARGVVRGPDNGGYFCLIVKMKSGQELKILETGNIKKIRKEVSTH